MKNIKKTLSAILVGVLFIALLPVNAVFAADEYSSTSVVLLYNAYGDYGGYGGHTVDYVVADGTDANISRYGIWSGEGDYINYLDQESWYTSGVSANAHSTFQTVVGGRLVKGVAYSSCSCYGEIDEGSYMIYQ